MNEIKIGTKFRVIYGADYGAEYKTVAEPRPDLDGDGMRVTCRCVKESVLPGGMEVGELNDFSVNMLLNKDPYEPEYFEEIYDNQYGLEYDEMER